MRGIDLAEREGISYRQLHHWTTRGYVLALGGHLPQGNAILEYSPSEARIVRIMSRLVKWGVKPENAADMARQHVDGGRGVTIFDIDGVGHLHLVG